MSPFDEHRVLVARRAVVRRGAGLPAAPYEWTAGDLVVTVVLVFALLVVLPLALLVLLYDALRTWCRARRARQP